MSAKPSFFAELQRRNVHRAAVFYAGAAWLLVQVATQVLPFFHIEERVVRWIVVAAVTGFPFALLFSWFYEWTPQGIKRESEIERSVSITPQTGKKLDRAIIAVLGLAVVLLLANTLLPRKQAEPAATPAIPAKSIAVLPFTDLSPAHDQEYFSDGMAEELLNALAKVKDLKVAGRTSSFSFKGRNEDLRSIGQALAVANVLEGSVRKQGNRVRITAQLIQVADGYHLWSETYDGDLTDVFDLQEHIARAITGQLQAILEGGQQQRLVPVATGNPEAYALYLRATTIFNHRDGAHFPEAIAALQEAVRLDPKYARAHARLAAVYAISTSVTPMDRIEADASAEHEAQIALELDPTLAEPHAALGLVYGQRWQRIEARRELEQAVALDPDDATANFWLAAQLTIAGYRKQGTARLDQVLAIDPLLPVALLWRGTEYLNVGEREQARRMLQQAVDGGLVFGKYGLALAEHADGHSQQAIDDLSQGVQVLFTGFPDNASRLVAAGIYGDKDARTSALAAVDAYLGSKPRVTSGGAPWALLMLGEPARALAVAQEGPTRNDALFYPRLWSPSGDAARRLPQFAEFARRTGLAGLWDQYGAPDNCRRVAPGDYVCD